MIPEEKVIELVRAHTRLEEPTTAAIRIHPETSEASELWLVEVIPAMANDDNADEPTYFNPGPTFRFPFAIIAGNLRSLESALRRNKKLARSIAAGKVLLSGPDADALRKVAVEVSTAP